MPSYTWVCGACTTSNPPGQEDCIACHCPAASSQQLRAQYRAAFDGVGPPVVPKDPPAPPPPKVREPRAPRFQPGTLWFVACYVLMGAWTLSLFLLWGGGPLIPGAGSPSTSHWYWSLPSEVESTGLLTVLLAPPAFLVCVARALRKQYKKSLSRGLAWAGLLVVAALLAMCSS